ncbi:MAG: hypothetical protein U9N85_07655, partial [Bacteroidota bacterium]|nr:hypothetical protein [Bacteroidota bacterium]
KEDASQETILAAISENQKNKQAAEQKLADIQADRIKILLGSDAVNDDNREHLEKLAEQDFDLAQKTVSILEQKQEKAETKTDDGVRLSDAIKKNTKSDEPKTWKDLSDKERLNLRENNSVKYIELFKSEYGFDPEMN